MDIPHLFIHFSVKGHVYDFRLLAILSDAAMNINPIKGLSARVYAADDTLKRVYKWGLPRRSSG